MSIPSEKEKLKLTTLQQLKQSSGTERPTSEFRKVPSTRMAKEGNPFSIIREIEGNCQTEKRITVTQRDGAKNLKIPSVSGDENGQTPVFKVPSVPSKRTFKDLTTEGGRLTLEDIRPFLNISQEVFALDESTPPWKQIRLADKETLAKAKEQLRETNEGDLRCDYNYSKACVETSFYLEGLYVKTLLHWYTAPESSRHSADDLQRALKEFFNLEEATMRGAMDYVYEHLDVHACVEWFAYIEQVIAFKNGQSISDPSMPKSVRGQRRETPASGGAFHFVMQAMSTFAGIMNELMIRPWLIFPLTAYDWTLAQFDVQEDYETAEERRRHVETKWEIARKIQQWREEVAHCGATPKMLKRKSIDNEGVKTTEWVTTRLGSVFDLLREMKGFRLDAIPESLRYRVDGTLLGPPHSREEQEERLKRLMGPLNLPTVVRPPSGQTNLEAPIDFNPSHAELRHPVVADPLSKCGQRATVLRRVNDGTSKMSQSIRSHPTAISNSTPSTSSITNLQETSATTFAVPTVPIARPIARPHHRTTIVRPAPSTSSSTSSVPPIHIPSSLVTTLTPSPALLPSPTPISLPVLDPFPSTRSTEIATPSETQLTSDQIGKLLDDYFRAQGIVPPPTPVNTTASSPLHLPISSSVSFAHPSREDLPSTTMTASLSNLSFPPSPHLPSSSPLSIPTSAILTPMRKNGVSHIVRHDSLSASMAPSIPSLPTTSGTSQPFNHSSSALDRSSGEDHEIWQRLGSTQDENWTRLEHQRQKMKPRGSIISRKRRVDPQEDASIHTPQKCATKTSSNVLLQASMDSSLQHIIPAAFPTPPSEPGNDQIMRLLSEFSTNTSQEITDTVPGSDRQMFDSMLQALQLATSLP